MLQFVHLHSSRHNITIFIVLISLCQIKKWIVPQMGLRERVHHIHISDWLIASLSMCAEQRIRYMLFPIRAQHSGSKLIFDRWRLCRTGGKVNDDTALSTIQLWWNSVWISHIIMWCNRESGFLNLGLSCFALHNIMSFTSFCRCVYARSVR